MLKNNKKEGERGTVKKGSRRASVASVRQYCSLIVNVS